MKEIQKLRHVEIHPETEADLESLRRGFPHLWPFDFVCVANPPPTSPSDSTLRVISRLRRRSS